jgi:hypothetical protein
MLVKSIIKKSRHFGWALGFWKANATPKSQLNKAWAYEKKKLRHNGWVQETKSMMTKASIQEIRHGLPQIKYLFKKYNMSFPQTTTSKYPLEVRRNRARWQSIHHVNNMWSRRQSIHKDRSDIYDKGRWPTITIHQGRHGSDKTSATKVEWLQQSIC